jgi:mannose-6-phosphate isomerase-like protein (cupin superfamily)
MGYRIPANRQIAPTPELLLANSADVSLQVLASHGPTTQFKLLMGQTTSRRDRLAAASEMTSLFIMDFAAGGTNIPHSHAAEEEIYLLMRGSGEIVAGRTGDGQDSRHPVKEGAVFFFGPGTRVGYYSGAKEGRDHDLILAVRSRLP